ncbi:MAG: phytoene/squalene synthase family protein [Planctomycetaceae bacterium]|nr:phytoene/squalene synthase family protein [Planctomycetaceae bacterium]MCB9950601.1 phytoene/squalene synthase family protein [Planctomycetaceae bacterium]
MTAGHAVSLEDSYRHCQKLAKKSRSNFYCSFFALPRSQFRDMCVLYAYMRRTDDIGDAEGRSLDERRQQLSDWEAGLQAALRDGRMGTEPIFPSLAEMVRRHSIPHQLLFDVIAGVESDLAPRRFADMTALQRYCYHVAGVVGLSCVHIWGNDGDPAVRDLAIDCGLAFQLTNILRDVGEDIRHGRVYLPQDLLQRHGCTEQELAQPSASSSVRAAVAELLGQARELLERSRALETHLSRDGARMYRAMQRTYGHLQEAIAKVDYDVLKHRASLSTLQTLGIAWSCVWDRWVSR